jgi:polyhydroxybutyrate depolymerase
MPSLDFHPAAFCALLAVASVASTMPATAAGTSPHAAAEAAMTPRPAGTASCGQPGQITGCTLAAWPDRPVQLYVPSTTTTGSALPVVVLLHGGSGNSAVGIDATCPGADRSHPSCLHQIAERRQFVLVVPNGTRSNPPAANRAWNAGGGGLRAAGGRWQCVGGNVCEAGVDDVAYIRAVLAQLPAWTGTMPSHVYATGLSNGGALAHRLACEAADVFQAIASVGAGNQFATSASCQPQRPVAMLAVHGTGDPCWRYGESDLTCVITTPVGYKVGALESAAGWAQRNGCTADPDLGVEEDVDGNGIRTATATWTRCRAPVELLTLEGAPPSAPSSGAGHTYPDGHQYLPVDQIGPTDRDWTMERVWEFFVAQQSRPLFDDGFEPAAPVLEP